MTRYEVVSGVTECGTCKYFSQTGEPDYWGDCRRRAPTNAASTFEAYWPIISGEDWCGDYVRVLVDSDGNRVRLG